MDDDDEVSVRAIVFHLDGEPIRWEIPTSLYRMLKSVIDKTNIPLQNIVGPACHKYGRRHESIRKYIERDLRRRVRR